MDKENPFVSIASSTAVETDDETESENGFTVDSDGISELEIF